MRVASCLRPREYQTLMCEGYRDNTYSLLAHDGLPQTSSGAVTPQPASAYPCLHTRILTLKFSPPPSPSPISTLHPQSNLHTHRPFNPGASAIGVDGAITEHMEQITIDGLLHGPNPPKFPDLGPDQLPVIGASCWCIDGFLLCLSCLPPALRPDGPPPSTYAHTVRMHQRMCSQASTSTSSKLTRRATTWLSLMEC